VRMELVGGLAIPTLYKSLFLTETLVQSFSSNGAVACDYPRGSSSSFWRSPGGRCPAEKRIRCQNAVARHCDLLHPGTSSSISSSLASFGHRSWKMR